jgi:transcriptional regulator with XRE-family HTH domain
MNGLAQGESTSTLSRDITMSKAVLPYHRLGRKVFFRRFALKLSLDDFEQATGIPKSHWIELEKGTRPFTTDDLQLLSRLLDVPPTWFLEIQAEMANFYDEGDTIKVRDVRSMGQAPGLMEIMLPNGTTVVVDPDFDADALNRLMSLLEKR